MSDGQPRHYSEREFEGLVQSAIDDLPPKFQRALENVPIVVSDRGAEHRAYGMYIGVRMGNSNFLGGGARGFFGGASHPEEILIFRDTLVRDFGDDSERLRAQVTKTVRHEVGHYFGFDEAGVRKLGL